jgi:hypothetical protein
MSRFNAPSQPTYVKRSSTIPPPSPFGRRNPFGVGRAATTFGNRIRMEAEAARPPMSPQYVTYAYSDDSDISDIEEFSSTESVEASLEYSPGASPLASPQMNPELAPSTIPEYSPLPSPDLTPELSPGKDDRYYMMKAMERLRGTRGSQGLSPESSPQPSPLPSPQFSQLSPQPSPVDRPMTAPEVIVQATKPPIRKASKPVYKKSTEQLNSKSFFLNRFGDQTNLSSSQWCCVYGPNPSYRCRRYGTSSSRGRLRLG